MKTQLALPGDTNIARGSGADAPFVREAVGPDTDLMCDINQRWSVQQAIEFGKQVEDVPFFLVEMLPPG